MTARTKYPSDSQARRESARPAVTVSLDRELLAAIDAARGEVSRSRWLEDVARARLAAIDEALQEATDHANA